MGKWIYSLPTGPFQDLPRIQLHSFHQGKQTVKLGGRNGVQDSVFPGKALEFVHGAASVASQRRSIGHRRRCSLYPYGNPVDFRCTRAKSPWRVTRRWAGCNQTYWGLRKGSFVAIACRWYPRVSMKIPITIMGNDSSCPMEIDPKKNPI